MPDDNQTGRPRPIPHVRLYVCAGALCVASGVALMVAFAWPHVPAMPNMAAGFAVMAVLVIVGTAAMWRNERYDADRGREHMEVMKRLGQLETLGEDIREHAMVRLEIYAQAIRAEQRDMYDRAIKELTSETAITERLDEFLDEVEKRLAVAGAEEVAALRAQVEELRARTDRNQADQMTATLDRFREEMEDRFAAALLEIIHSQEDGKVVPIQQRKAESGG